MRYKYTITEVNKEQDALDELQEQEDILNAQIVAKDLSSNTQKLIQVCRVLLGNAVDSMTIPELKRDILIYAQNNPEDFINTINDPMLQLQDDGKEIYYNLPNNKRRLLTVPFGEDPDWMVASFFQSDEGVEIYKLLKNRLKKGEIK